MTAFSRIFFLGVLLLYSGISHAQTSCSAADLRGDFATQPQGILTIGPFAGPFAATGIIHFDGEGRFDGVATSSFNGSVIFPFDAVGSYSVTPDCFVDIFEETLRIAFEGYIAKGKNQVVLFQPQDTAITTNVLRRLQIPPCAAGTLRDGWAIQAEGSNIVTSGSFAQAGRFDFDGNGNLHGVTKSSLNGKIVSHSVNGSYRMNADCTFSARFLDETGKLSNFFGTMFGDGNEFIFLYSNDGIVIPGQARRIASLGQGSCASADARGSFAVQIQGILTTGPFAGPYAISGIMTLDGGSRFVATGTGSFNGTVTPLQVSGDYTVGSDCFVTTYDPAFPLAFEGYLARDKREIVLVQSQEASIGTNILRRISLPSCDSGTLNNNWTIQSSGSNIAESGRFAQNGRLRFDGNGNLQGVTASSPNGVLVRHTVNGTYQMNSNCSFTAEFQDENGQSSSFTGIMFGDGGEFIFIYSNEGLVISGQARQAVAD